VDELNNILAWVNKSKDWLFSGIGLFIIAPIVTVIQKKLYSNNTINKYNLHKKTRKEFVDAIGDLEHFIRNKNDILKKYDLIKLEFFCKGNRPKLKPLIKHLKKKDKLDYDFLQTEIDKIKDLYFKVG
jgi:hypothetical protein